MFTGLVEGRGTVAAIESQGSSMRLTVQPPASMLDEPVDLGASVAINGCCLTVVEAREAGWAFEAGEETLSKTNLGDAQPGSIVNLERSLRANARLGGHFVQGHVDGVGRVRSIRVDGEWTDMEFDVPAELARLMVPKGSVTVDGVSLTVVKSEPELFSVALIPHTLQETTLGVRTEGDRVNIETDILGKYIEKFLAGRE